MERPQVFPVEAPEAPLSPEELALLEALSEEPEQPVLRPSPELLHRLRADYVLARDLDQLLQEQSFYFGWSGMEQFLPNFQNPGSTRSSPQAPNLIVDGIRLRSVLAGWALVDPRFYGQIDAQLLPSLADSLGERGGNYVLDSLSQVSTSSSALVIQSELRSSDRAVSGFTRVQHQFGQLGFQLAGGGRYSNYGLRPTEDAVVETNSFGVQLRSWWQDPEFVVLGAEYHGADRGDGSHFAQRMAFVRVATQGEKYHFKTQLSYFGEQYRASQNQEINYDVAQFRLENTWFPKEGWQLQLVLPGEYGESNQQIVRFMEATPSLGLSYSWSGFQIFAEAKALVVQHEYVPSKQTISEFLYRAGISGELGDSFGFELASLREGRLKPLALFPKLYSRSYLKTYFQSESIYLSLVGFYDRTDRYFGVFNIASADVFGGWLEGVWQVLDNFSLRGSFLVEHWQSEGESRGGQSYRSLVKARFLLPDQRSFLEGRVGFREGLITASESDLRQSFEELNTVFGLQAQIYLSDLWMVRAQLQNISEAEPRFFRLNSYTRGIDARVGLALVF